MKRDWEQRIEVNSDILMGSKPVSAGTRIPVSLILNLLASINDAPRIVEACPLQPVCQNNVQPSDL